MRVCGKDTEVEVSDQRRVSSEGSWDTILSIDKLSLLLRHHPPGQGSRIRKGLQMADRLREDLEFLS